MSGPMGHYWLASRAMGDDTTLTRYVRDHRGEAKPKRRQTRLPGIGTATFINEGRTKFSKSVKRTDAMRHLLVSGHSNVKIGRDVRKAKFRGYWIFTLSFEERKTCPSSCRHWQTCYGNNMPFAKRIDHTDPKFLSTLEGEIAMLCKKHLGILIRLHALGDFFSVEYVEFWHRMLRRHSNLALYGYTARNNLDEIGPAIFRLRNRLQDRAMIRSSDGERHNMSTVSIGTEDGCPLKRLYLPGTNG